MTMLVCMKKYPKSQKERTKERPLAVLLLFPFWRRVSGRRDKSTSHVLSVWMKEHLLLNCSTVLYESIVALVIGLAGMGAWTERNQRLFAGVEAQVGDEVEAAGPHCFLEVCQREK